MAERIASLYAEIGAKTDGLKAGLASAKAGLTGFAANAKSSLANAGAAWSEIATPLNQTIQILGQVGQAAQQAYAFVSEGTQLARTQEQFAALSKSIGTTSDALMGQLRTATRGTVSDFDLMRGASSLVSLGLTETSEDTVRLTKLIGQLGWDMNQVTLTLANQSTMRLDALGLSVTDVEDRVKALEAQGYATDEAFKFAIIEAGEAKLTMLGDAADTAAGKLKILEANAANLKDNFQATFSETFITRLNDFSGGLFETAEGASAAGKSFGESVADLIAFGIHMRTAADVVQDLTGEFENGTVATRQNKTAMSEQRAATIAATAATDGWMASLNTVTTMTPQATRAIIDNATAIYQTSDAYAEFQDKLVQSSNQLSENEAMVATANARMVEWSETIPTVTGAIYASDEAVAAYNANLGQLYLQAQNAAGGAFDVAAAFTDSASAIGANAEEIAGLQMAFGDLEPAAAEALIKEVLLREEIARLTEEVKNKNMTIYEARDAYIAFQEGLSSATLMVNEATGSVNLLSESEQNASQSTQSLLDKFGLFPGEVNTVVNVDTSEAESRISSLEARLAGLGSGGMPGTASGGNQSSPDLPGQGHAAGADFIVPPGYPNDSYPMRVQSGERVQVTPAGQSSGGNTYNLYVTAMDGGANVAREFNYMKALSNV